MMVKILMIYDLVEGALDSPVYTKYNEKTMELFRQLKADGILLEFKTYKNITGNPFNVAETTWKSIEDWGRFYASDKYQRVLKLGEPFYKDLRVFLLQEEATIC